VLVGKGLEGFGFGSAKADLQPGTVKPKLFPAARHLAAHAWAQLGPRWYRVGAGQGPCLSCYIPQDGPDPGRTAPRVGLMTRLECG
jgi:hypothetical protein